MSKKESLELELNFEIKKAEILERKANIYYKLVFIFIIGFISININLFNSTLNDFYSSVDKNENKFKDDLKLVIEATMNAKTPEIARQNYDFQLKLIKEHFNYIEIMETSKQKVKENKDDFFTSIFRFFIILSVPIMYFYYRMNQIERKIVEIQRKLVNETKRWRKK